MGQMEIIGEIVLGIKEAVYKGQNTAWLSKKLSLMAGAYNKSEIPFLGPMVTILYHTKKQFTLSILGS